MLSFARLLKGFDHIDSAKQAFAEDKAVQPKSQQTSKQIENLRK